MPRTLARASVAALAGLIASAVCLAVLYGWRPALVFDLARTPTSVIDGLYPVERDASGLTYAWSRERLAIALPGLDRTIAWHLHLRYRGARPGPHPQPVLRASVDGVVLAPQTATNELQDFDIMLPPRGGDIEGATVEMVIDPTFEPGPSDRRALGVQVDEIRVVPEPGAWVLPPTRALLGTALAAAVLGAAFGALGMTPGSAIGGAALLALGLSMVIANGSAPYSNLPGQSARAACWIAGLVMLAAAGWRASSRELRNTARFAVAFSASVLLLELAVLWHPDIDVRDAVFQAHRFEWVLDGRFYFTSLAPGNYEFPYAIGLYVAAAPFAAFVDDLAGEMRLLKAVVAGANVLAGLAVYAAMTHMGLPRRAAAMALALYHLVPLGFAVQWVANQTNAFGQSVFTATMALVAVGAARAERPALRALPALALVCTFLSHTSTFAIALAVLVLLVALAAVSRDAGTRRQAWPLAVATIVALAVAWVSYYGHFLPVYQAQAARILGELQGTRPPVADAATPITRLLLVPRYLQLYFGWSTLALAAAGAWTFWRGRRPEASPDAQPTLSVVLIAWLTGCALFLVIGVLTPVDMRYYLAVVPALAILGGIGADAGWHAGRGARCAIILLLLAAAWSGVAQWMQPLAE